MKVLIVESKLELAALWQRHLARQGCEVVVATSVDAAVLSMSEVAHDVIILDLILEGGSALAVADYAQYRLPEASVIFVTDTTFFSDGSIFSVSPNARALVRTSTPPEDLAAMVDHYGRAA
ncbi:MAG: response regulator [Rhodobacterales bacterium]|nr:response regulator [Rhodobacterales bacterium]NCT11148.1 response regulator [Rhodobacterales bacterium]